MRTIERARKLSESIIETAAKSNLKTDVLITDMNECLGRTSGNALEISEAVRFLRDEDRESRLNEVTLALCAQMLLVSGIESDRATALARVDDAVTSGRRFRVRGRMIHGMGGPADFTDKYEQYLPAASTVVPVHAAEAGYLSSVDTFCLGGAVIELGGGRRTRDDNLDLSVGLADVAQIGSQVDDERPLALIHAASADDAERAADFVRSACQVSDTAPESTPVIHESLTGQ